MPLRISLHDRWVVRATSSLVFGHNQLDAECIAYIYGFVARIRNRRTNKLCVIFADSIRSCELISTTHLDCVVYSDLFFYRVFDPFNQPFSVCDALEQSFTDVDATTILLPFEVFGLFSTGH